MDTSFHDYFVSAAILLPSAEQAQVAMVTVIKCDPPRFRHGVGKLGECRFAPSWIASTFMEDGKPFTAISDKASDNRQ